MNASAGPAMIELRGVAKRYGAHAAVDGTCELVAIERVLAQIFGIDAEQQPESREAAAPAEKEKNA